MSGTKIRGYYLDIRELLEGEDKESLWGEAFRKVDGNRRKKAERCTRERARAASLGAGLLLQVALLEQGKQKALRSLEEQGKQKAHLTQEEAEWEAGTSEEVCSASRGGAGKNFLATENESWQIFTVREVLSRISTPYPIQYRYGEAGKPYFLEEPWYFNISHSGDYVLCVVSEEETGADLQRLEEADCTRLAKRFFSAAEYEAVRRYDQETKKQRMLFFEIWARKEAWGKLTGQGVVSVLGEDILAGREQTGKPQPAELQPEGLAQAQPAEPFPEKPAEPLPHWLSIPVPEGYVGAVCQWKERKS